MGLYGSMFPSPLPWQNQPGYQIPEYDSPQQAQGRQQGGTSLLEAIPSLLYNFKGLSTRPQEDIANQLQQVSSAQLDTSNPLYQQIYGQQKAAATQNLAQGIQELTNRNRKLASMGRVPLFDPERGGEQLFRVLTQGYQNAGNMAHTATEQVLGNAGSTLNTAYNNANNLAMMQNLDRYQEAKGQTGVAGILKSLFGL